ncbi:ATPase, T2SS/T4P/T4SS family [Pyrobaculum calidifontis]|uniref:Type II secretion system protein E n=1 Tax=Pyrobaculum calidifontis (strain DSM 21063 / JCM 11548 / VA1) TaxID=410359 RepID=A3MV12_PYRCJ|nr:ATPase, T2SS/T4P/T4SS family [Pyrobaculum calidifontis]ABO08479.1 type II secretion system protein E [Pyrobaculum calidifontis JCM 11548]
MYDVVLRVLECLECRYACAEKQICNFKEEELAAVIKVVSRIYAADLDKTLEARYNLLKKINKDFALEATLATVGLAKLAPYIRDEEVEDLVLIPNRPIYIATRRGKLKTNTTATAEMIKNFLRLAHLKGVELTYARPSLRFGLRFGVYRLRISLDLPPIVPYPHVYVRIHRRKLRLSHLLSSGFLSVEQLKTIYAAVKGGKHLVVAGPPGAGKTTLLVAIDELIPPTWQRVYIDEADEFDEDPDKNQIKIADVNKSREIYASLNRNIDVVFIGELQYEDHFNAFKTATEIGLQTFATMHAATIEDALKRLAKYVEVKNMAVVLVEKKYGDVVKRRVADVYVS